MSNHRPFPRLPVVILAIAAAVAPQLHAALVWSGIPTQVNTGDSISFSVYENTGGPTPPTVTLKLNGSFVGADTQGLSYSGSAPSTAQTLTFYATSTYGASSTKTVQVVSANTPPFGSFDTLTSTVYQGQSATANGWASDTEQGSPITRVDIYLDGSDIGDATLSLYNSSYPNAGWSYSIATGSLSLGTHTVEVRFVDNNGAVTTKPSKSFTVADSTPTTTSCTASSSTIASGTSVTISATTTDPGSELTAQYVEYMAPGSSTWVSGSPNWATSGSSYWTGGPVSSHTISATKALFTTGTWQFRARGRDSANRYSAYKHVNVSVTAPAGTISDTFESGFGNWSNPGGSYLPWTRDSGGTPSSSTGPNHDKTTGGSTGYYLYVETSYGSAYYSGDEAVVESVPFTCGSQSGVTFAYHMYGSNMGTLYLEVFDGSNWQKVWSIQGQQQTSYSAAYKTAGVDLSDFSGSIKLRFRCVAAGGYMGDMAIDDVMVVTNNPDIDGDGLSTAYEKAHGLNPSLNDANFDADNDGRTNMQEYQQGTNPQSYDGVSFFDGQTSSIAVPGSGTLIIVEPPYSTTASISLPTYVKP